MPEAKTSSHAGVSRNKHTILRYLALTTRNALRWQEFPITEQGRDLHDIFAVGKQLKELKY